VTFTFLSAIKINLKIKKKLNKKRTGFFFIYFKKSGIAFALADNLFFFIKKIIGRYYIMSFLLLIVF
jgi:hypothetical protein